MKNEYSSFPIGKEKHFSICDATIDRIDCFPDSVQFHFSGGFKQFDGETIIYAGSGAMELKMCDAEEFTCRIAKRKMTAQGAVIKAYPVSLEEISNLLAQKEKTIEIHLELYDFNYLYWRGTLLPYQKRGLSDHVTIEICGCFPLTIIWSN